MSDTGGSGAPIFSQPGWQVGEVYNVAGDLILTKESSTSDFVKALEDLKAELNDLQGVDDERKAHAQSLLDASIEEAKAGSPSKDQIVDRLKQAESTLEAGTSVAEKAWKLAKTIGKVAAWATAFFA